MTLDPELVQILVCPNDRGEIDYREDEQVIVCRTCGYRYPVRDDIPVMLIDEAETVDQTEHARIMAKVEAESLKPTFQA
jgi:uncharacterized protein YbaR (Trm112 family)